MGLGFRVIYCSHGKEIWGLTDAIGWLGYFTLGIAEEYIYASILCICVPV